MTVLAASPLWYLSRGSGVVSLLLLTAAVLLGVASVRRWSARRLPRFVVAGLHRNLTLLAVVFVCVHVLTAIADGYVSIRLVDAFVPFVSSYRPVWLGLGALAFDLVLALVASSLLRRHLGRRVWRSLHWLAYASWPIALAHGLGTGGDFGTGWMQLLTAACAGAVLVAVAWRLVPVMRGSLVSADSP